MLRGYYQFGLPGKQIFRLLMYQIKDVVATQLVPEHRRAIVGWFGGPPADLQLLVFGTAKTIHESTNQPGRLSVLEKKVRLNFLFPILFKIMSVILPLLPALHALQANPTTARAVMDMNSKLNLDKHLCIRQSNCLSATLPASTGLPPIDGEINMQVVIAFRLIFSLLIHVAGAAAGSGISIDSVAHSGSLPIYSGCHYEQALDREIQNRSEGGAL